jgi:hypothetical protein
LNTKQAGNVFIKGRLSRGKHPIKHVFDKESSLKIFKILFVVKGFVFILKCVIK